MATAEELRKEAETLRQLASSGEFLSSEPQAVVMSLMAEAASLMWAASAREHVESEGGKFFDYKHTWLPAREAAIQAYRRACDRARRKAGDEQIYKRLEESGHANPAGSYNLTPARRKVIAAIVRIASGSGRLYCSYLTLAKAARVSARTACAVRAELEDLGVLERVRTGGKHANGSCHSNKYTVKWNTLREVLSIENRWESRYPADSKRLFQDPLKYGRKTANNQSILGYAHYPSGRRIRKPHPKAIRGHAGEISKNSTVENCLCHKAGVFLAVQNTAPEQGFCAVTELIERNKPFITNQEGLPFLEYVQQPKKKGNETRGRALLSAVDPNLLRRLNRASESKRSFILSELDLHIEWTPTYASLPVMVRDYLAPLLNAEGL